MISIESNLSTIKEIIKDSFVVIDSAVKALHFENQLSHAYIVEGSEGLKTFSNLELLLSAFKRAGLNRNSKVLAIGGGSVGDLTGLASSVYMRGIEYSIVPTTLLSMADSAIGGKTAINFEGAKNLIGTFHSAKNCIINIGFLATLDRTQLLSGLGEVVKTAFLDSAMLESLPSHLPKLISGDLDSLLWSVEQCVRVKSSIVESDFLDNSTRRSLNLGHTVGHALEALTGLPHGLCVLRGLQIEADIFKSQMGSQYYKIHELTQTVLDQSGVRFDIDRAELLSQLCFDKKNKDNTIGFVYCKDGQIAHAQLGLDEVDRLLKI